MKYDIYSTRLPSKQAHSTQGGLTKAPRSTGTYKNLTFIGKLLQRNLGRRGLTLAMKLEKKSVLAPIEILYFLFSK